MRVAITIDAAALRSAGGGEELAITSVTEVAQSVRTALEAHGHRVQTVALPAAPAALFAAVSALPAQADLVFNLAESLGRASGGEVMAAWLLAATGLPVTGASPRALSLCLDKSVTRAVLAQGDLGLPTGAVYRGAESEFSRVRFPAIVKPLCEDASHGIDEGSVVADPEAALRRAQAVAERYGAALVEEFIDGRELQVAMLGRAGEAPRLLPFGEIDYTGMAAHSPRILTYAAKWDEGSAHYLTTPAIPARALSPDLEAQIERLARLAWLELGLSGYARVDLRLHAERGPFVIDVNPNPDLSPGAGFSLAAARAGMSYDALILQILDLAARPGRP